MEKITGKFFARWWYGLVWCLVYSACVESVEVKLQLATHPSRVFAGIAWHIRAIVTGSSAVEAIDLVYPAEVEVQSHTTTQNISTINGVTTKTVCREFGVKCNTPGTYTIGPVHVRSNGQTYQSNQITVEVVLKTQVASDDDPVAIALVSPVTQAYVGQEIPLEMNVYVYDQGANVQAIQPPEFRGVEPMSIAGPEKYTQSVNGRPATVLTYQTTLIAQNAGQLVVPPAQMVYSHIAQPTRRVINSFYHSLFDEFEREVQKVGYSNALTFEITPLPAHTSPVHAVGSFRAVRAYIDRTSTQQDQGITLTLEIDGRGHILTYPALELGADATYYESTKKTQSNREDERTISADYIIQRFTPGIWQIEPQTFTYFDPVDERYYELKTERLSVQVDARQMPDDSSEPSTSVVSAMPITSHGGINLITRTLGHQAASNGLRSDTFVGMLLLLWLSWLIWLIYYIGQAYYTYHRSYYTKKYAFVLARRQLTNAASVGTVEDIFMVFRRLIAQRQMIEPQELSGEQLAQIFACKSVDINTADEWRKFLARLQECTFYPSVECQKSFEPMRAQALGWVTRLQEAL